MKVRELINSLSKFDDDMEVVVQADSNDYWHTQLALNIYRVSTELCVHSVRHDSLKLATLDKESDSDDAREYVVIG